MDRIVSMTFVSEDQFIHCDVDQFTVLSVRCEVRKNHAIMYGVAENNPVYISKVANDGAVTGNVNGNQRVTVSLPDDFIDWEYLSKNFDVTAYSDSGYRISPRYV